MQTFERPTVQWLVITFFKQVMNVTLKQVPGKTAATITQQLPHPIHRLLVKRRLPTYREARTRYAVNGSFRQQRCAIGYVTTWTFGTDREQHGCTCKRCRSQGHL